uniref:IP07919p n=1 Tax=Drosophila melanogaster TaxID=7227 RepID=Q4V5Z9_DROME|nr:IP07919p [Drosophila melanogaster]
MRKHKAPPSGSPRTMAQDNSQSELHYSCIEYFKQEIKPAIFTTTKNTI